MIIDLVTRAHGKRLLALLLAALLLAQMPFAAGAYVATEDEGVAQIDEDETENSATVSAQGASAQDYVSGIYTYKVVNGKAIITECDGWATGSITIPSTLGGYTVTEIDDYAFNYRDITGVTIPDTVKRIGESAFDWCTDLTYVKIGNGVTEIETDAFAWCSKLSNLTIGSSVKTIGHSAFYRTAISSLTLPSSVTSIDDYAFGYCTKLVSVTIGSGLSNIGEGAFYSCSALTGYSVSSGNAYFSSDSYGVLYNKNKTELIQYPIGNTRTSFTIPSSVTDIGYAAFQNSKRLSSVSFPDSVKAIGESAFLDCTGLIGSIILGNKVTRIEDFAFRNCTQITGVQIGTGLTRIGELAFYACKSVTAITVSTGNVYFCSDNGVLFNKAKTELIQYPAGSSNTAYTVPASVRTIRSGAFVQSQKLKMLNIENGTQKIEWGALEFCPALEQVQIPNTVTELCYCNIRACNALQKVELPASISRIEHETVADCSSLEYVHIPASVTSIDYKTYGNNLLSGTSAYICSETADCYAKTYADAHNKAFRLCSGHTSGVTLTKIAVKTMPTKTTYYVGDSFDQSGLTLTATYSDSSTKTITSGFTCTGFSSATAGTKTITVSYSGKTVTLNVTVNAATLTKIAVKTLPTKTTYNVGESFNQSGLTLTATYSDGSTKTIASGFTCTGFSSATIGTKTITVTYEGKTTTLSVTVIAATNPTIRIHNYVSSRHVFYGTVVCLKADVENAPVGSEVHWFGNGEEAIVDDGTGVYVTMKMNRIDVQAKLLDAKGNVLAESEVETLTTRTNIFARLLYFLVFFFIPVPTIYQ